MYVVALQSNDLVSRIPSYSVNYGAALLQVALFFSKNSRIVVVPLMILSVLAAINFSSDPLPKSPSTFARNSACTLGSPLDSSSKVMYSGTLILL